MNHYFPKQSQPAGRKPAFTRTSLFFSFLQNKTLAGQNVTNVAQVNCIVPFFNMTSFCCAIKKKKIQLTFIHSASHYLIQIAYIGGEV